MTITSSGRSYYAIRRFLVLPRSKREISRSLNSTTRIAVRFHSSSSSNSNSSSNTSSASSASTSTNQCPHSSSSSSSSNANNKNGNNNTTMINTDTVKYVNVPKLPIVGSMIPMFSNSVWFELNKSYDVWYKHWKTFGDFYNFGFPGLGKGVTGETYVLTNPNEFMKVLRKEGNYPFGAVTANWPIVNYYKEKTGLSSPGSAAGLALFSDGHDWQKMRRFMQTDLLHPTAAKGYVPGMIKACQTASEGAAVHAKNINEYTAFCSFDMFSSIAFGEFPGLASGRSKQEENEKFCKATIVGLEKISPMLMNPSERMKNLLGIQSGIYSTFDENFSIAREIGYRKLNNFKERKANGELQTDFEKLSYASLAMDRYLASVGQEDSLEEEDVGELIMVALIAALDTTSAVLNWCIIHLAMNPHVQEELYKEISRNIAKADDGDGTTTLTVDCFSKSNTVYLDAVLRENHRMTPPVAVNLMKENVTGDVEIHGMTIPKGNMFVLDSRSLGMDPDIIHEPDTFDPTRWFDDQAKLRRGTPAEVLDHPLYREPFSAGARKCPGSRVANYEAKIVLSQLVLDWKFSLADGKLNSWRDIAYFQGLTMQCEVPELSFEKRH